MNSSFSRQPFTSPSLPFLRYAETKGSSPVPLVLTLNRQRYRDRAMDQLLSALPLTEWQQSEEVLFIHSFLFTSLNSSWQGRCWKPCYFLHVSDGLCESGKCQISMKWFGLSVRVVLNRWGVGVVLNSWGVGDLNCRFLCQACQLRVYRPCLLIKFWSDVYIRA